jgi:hypothetical protein
MAMAGFLAIGFQFLYEDNRHYGTKLEGGRQQRDRFWLNVWE